MERQQGVRIARKHIGWYLDNVCRATLQFKKKIFAVSDADTQFNMVRNYLQDADIKNGERCMTSSVSKLKCF